MNDPVLSLPELEAVVRQMQDEPPPKILGRILTGKEWLAWCVWAETGDLSKASHQAQIPLSELLAWTSEAWWQVLSAQWVSAKQIELAHGLLRRVPKALEALDDVLDGCDPKSASAIVKAVEFLASIGTRRNGKPLPKLIPQETPEGKPLSKFTSHELTEAALHDAEDGETVH